MHDPPTLNWRESSPGLHVGPQGDRIVAVLYTVVAQDASGAEWLEFCCGPSRAAR
jgi:hypothetical protein